MHSLAVFYYLLVGPTQPKCSVCPLTPTVLASPPPTLNPKTNPNPKPSKTKPQSQTPNPTQSQSQPTDSKNFAFYCLLSTPPRPGLWVPSADVAACLGSWIERSSVKSEKEVRIGLISFSRCLVDEWINGFWDSVLFCVAFGDLDGFRLFFGRLSYDVIGDLDGFKWLASFVHFFIQHKYRGFLKRNTFFQNYVFLGSHLQIWIFQRINLECQSLSYVLASGRLQRNSGAFGVRTMLIAQPLLGRRAYSLHMQWLRNLQKSSFKDIRVEGPLVRTVLVYTFETKPYQLLAGWHGKSHLRRRWKNWYPIWWASLPWPWICQPATQ